MEYESAKSATATFTISEVTAGALVCYKNADDMQMNNLWRSLVGAGGADVTVDVVSAGGCDTVTCSTGSVR